MNIPSTGHRVLFLLTNLALFAPAMAFSAQDDVQQQVQTAEQHATFASKAGNLKDTHLHLHHVINCLVGPDGEGFDAKAGNPCAEQGNGALNDTSVSMEERQTLEQALTLSRVGTHIKSYKPAHNTALAVRELLQEANKGK
jgi:hypothetical protein